MTSLADPAAESSTANAPVKLRQHDRNDLDTLRLAFAFAVILSHAYAFVDPPEPPSGILHTVTLGVLAVYGFFVLSGYLISRSWHRSPFLVPFLIKRVMRIYPAFVVAFLVSVFAFGPLGASDVHGYLRGVEWPRMVRQMLTLSPPQAPAIGPVFLQSRYPLLNGAMWTIRYEFGCYLAVAGLGLLGLLRRRAVTVAFLVCSVAAWIACKWWELRGGPPLPFWFVNGLTFSMPFAAGVVLGNLPFFRPFRPGLFCASLAVLFPMLFSPYLAQPAVSTIWGFIILSLGYARPGQSLLKRFPDVSYGTYLYGWPVEMVIVQYQRKIGAPELALEAALACLLLGLLSWYLVERPALRIVPNLIASLTSILPAKAR